MTDFGEQVDLTANLASILRRYPFSTGLFREILQNSDDAGATKQVSAARCDPCVLLAHEYCLVAGVRTRQTAIRN